MDQIPNFFIALREECSYENVEGRTYFDRTPYLNIRIQITKHEQAYSILFIDEEGDRMYINDFLADDLIALLKMERTIDARLQAKENCVEETNNKINEVGMQFRENTSNILKAIEYWYTDDIIVEIAVNHFIFFNDFVDEINKNQN